VRDALVLLIGIVIGFVAGMVVEWVSTLPRQYKR